MRYRGLQAFPFMGYTLYSKAVQGVYGVRKVHIHPTYCVDVLRTSAGQRIDSKDVIHVIYEVAIVTSRTKNII